MSFDPRQKDQLEEIARLAGLAQKADQLVLIVRESAERKSAIPLIVNSRSEGKP